MGVKISNIKGQTQAQGIENRNMRKIFGSTMEDIIEAGQKCIMRNFMFCSPH